MWYCFPKKWAVKLLLTLFGASPRSPLEPKHSDAESVSLWWLIVRSLHRKRYKEAVSPKFTPTPLLVNVRDTKSWPPCLNWDNPAERHSSSKAPDWLRPLLQLHHSSASSAVQSCFPYCSQALFQRALLNPPPAWKSPGLTLSFTGKPMWDARSSLGMGFWSWTTHWPDGNEPMKCYSHAIVKTFTRRELGWDNGEREYTGRGNILDAWEVWEK